MKILVISDAWHPQVNGVVRTYEYLQTELQKMGHIMHVIGPADFSMTVPMPGYNEIKLAIFPYRHLEGMINKFAPDHLHIATEGPLGWAARKYCRRYKQIFTTSYHTQFPDYTARRIARYLPFLHDCVHRLGRAYVRRFHAPAGGVMVATASLANQLQSWGFQSPLFMVSRGADLSLFKPGPQTLFQDLPKPVALYVGRVALEKSIGDFLSMEWKGSKVIVGDGPSLKDLQKQYPEARFAGVKTGEELAEYYRSADLFVFPSKTDTFGIVIVEALASGLPVAAYNVTGPKDIISENFLGALTDKDLSKAAQAAIACGRPEERSAYAKKKYTWENAAHEFEAALKESI